MGFNAKNFLKSCVNYPLVLCFVLICFVVYAFLPDYLRLLIYSSPGIVFITVVHRVLVSTRRNRLKKAKGEEKSNKEEPKFVQDDNQNEKDLGVDTNSRSSSQTQATRRRNVTEKNKEETNTSFIREIPKQNREAKVDSVNQNIAGSSSSYKGEMERGSSEDTEDEEGQRDRNNAVEWTEDDEKSVMDLGLSEIERNRRLESLIARRRSRRWLNLARKAQQKNLAMENAAMENEAQVASIVVPRNNPFLTNSSDSQTSPTPGSAPSILLPMRNPFDLPYDPQEEKPNLTGDEFHQEFMAAHQKDIMFCRHESFVRGPFERPDNRGRHALDRIRTKQMVIDEYGSGSSPKTFKAKRESILKSPKLAAWKRMAAERRENYRLNEFLFEGGPSVFGRITMRERRYHPENESHHTPRNSFASDMQVEVSESSSPPLTVDGDEESAYLNERDMEKKMGSGNEELWGASSSHLSEVDKIESSAREIHEVRESDILQVGFSRIKQKSEPGSAHLPPVKEVDQGPFDSNYFPHSKIGLLEPRPSDDGDQEKAKKINVGSHKSSGTLQNKSPYELHFEKLTPAAPHNTPVLAQNSVDEPSNASGFENVQEFAKDDNKETNLTDSGNESGITTNNFIQNLKMNERVDGEDEIPIKQENEREEPKSSADEGQPDKPTEEDLTQSKEIAENSTQVERNEIPESSENRGEESSVNRQSSNESIEQVSITTSSVSSPKSVLNPKFSVTSLPSLGQEYVDPQADDMENNRTVDISPENSAPFVPQNSTSNGTNFENLQETANPSIISHEESTAELLKPDEEQDSNVTKDTEGTVGKISQDIDSAASSMQSEPSETKKEEPQSNLPHRSVEEETGTNSNVNESSVVDDKDSSSSSQSNE